MVGPLLQQYTMSKAEHRKYPHEEYLLFAIRCEENGPKIGQTSRMRYLTFFELIKVKDENNKESKGHDTLQQF